MFGNSHNLRRSSTHAGNSTPRRRSLVIALVLALSIGSASQAAPAQAAPLRDIVEFSMKIDGKPKTTVCAGKTVTYTIKVIVKPINPGVPTPAVGPRPGMEIGMVKVEALSENQAVGDFVGAKKGIKTLYTAGADLYNSDLASLTKADFRFKANKAGKTTLYFDGLVEGQYVSVNLVVTVKACPETVKTLIQFHPGIYDITAFTEDVVMTADENGNYTGSAVLHWAYSNFSIPCSVSAADSSVSLTGKLDDDGGQFVGSETFGPTTAVGCRGSGGGAISPLQFKVASSGGVSTSTATAPPLSGSARIVVVPEGDKVVSFIPGNHEAGWHDFSSLFGSLLALH